MKWVFLFFFSGIIVFAVTLYIKLGAYKDVVFHEPKTHSFNMLYKEHIGPYYKISAVITEIETWATKNNILCSKTFGQFFDKPDSADEDRLRSHAGCLLSQEVRDLRKDFKVKKTEPQLYLSATFTGSPAIGPYVVYPKMQEWMKEHRRVIVGPVIETYQSVGSKSLTTNYYFPIE